MHGGKTCPGSDKGSTVCKVKSCVLGPDDCEFDGEEFCHWKNSKTADAKWLRHTGVTTSRHTGPIGDHTSGSSTLLFHCQHEFSP